MSLCGFGGEQGEIVWVIGFGVCVHNLKEWCIMGISRYISSR